MGLPVLGILGTIGELWGKHKETKFKLQEARLLKEIAKEEAEAKRYEKAAEIESNYDLEALRQQQFSWKDEFWTLVLAAPFIGAFVPGLQDYVMKGFEYIDNMPYWYQASIVGIIAATFGLRWYFSKKNL